MIKGPVKTYDIYQSIITISSFYMLDLIFSLTELLKDTAAVLLVNLTGGIAYICSFFEMKRPSMSAEMLK